jgi:hypothetical protein
MAEMKSAYEKALERAEKLGRLSPEEMKERKDAENAAIGKALAERYLEHGHNRILGEALARYTGDDKDIVATAALQHLVDAISLQDDKLTKRAMEGISTLNDDARTLKAKQKVLSLATAYKEAEKQAYGQMKRRVDRSGAELLDELAISGSAIGDIKLGASELWEGIQKELSQRFDNRLQEVKQELIESSLER